MSRLLLYRVKRSRPLDTDSNKWLKYYTDSNKWLKYYTDSNKWLNYYTEKLDKPKLKSTFSVGICWNTADYKQYNPEEKERIEIQKVNEITNEMARSPMIDWYKLLDYSSEVDKVLYSVVNSEYLDLIYKLRKDIHVHHFLGCRSKMSRIILMQLIKNLPKWTGVCINAQNKVNILLRVNKIVCNVNLAAKLSNLIIRSYTY